jgi:hypothetical protein
MLLLGPEVVFRSLDRYVSEKELDLVKLAASQVAQSGTCTPEVMRGKLFNTGSFGCLKSIHENVKTPGRWNRWLPQPVCRDPLLRFASRNCSDKHRSST